MNRASISGLALAAIITLATPGVTAHPLDPALLELTEHSDGTVDVLWRLPASRPRDAPLEPMLPEHCTQLAPADVHQGAQRITVRWRLDCGSTGLVGERLGVEGLSRRQTDALLRVHLADGRQVQTVLRGREPTFLVPAQTSRSQVFLSYLGLGVEHILTGADHLLFVLGLVLLVHRRSKTQRQANRTLLWTLTAFTVGHSVTLSLAVLGLVHVLPAAVEVLIAGSLFAVAVELTRQGQPDPTITVRWTGTLTFAFGLLHGLGFAGALTQIGLPEGEIPLALFAFNVGIELGQLGFVVGLLLMWLVLRQVLRWRRDRSMFESVVTETAPTVLPGAYFIGTLAAFWIFERLATLMGSLGS